MENNAENRQKIATDIARGLPRSDLEEYTILALEELYEKEPECFERDAEHVKKYGSWKTRRI